MNKLTKQDVFKMITIIRLNYQGSYEIDDEEEIKLVLDTWIECLADYDREVVAVAFKQAIKTCRTAPTIADIIKQIHIMQNATNKTEYDLWAELDKAIYDATVLYGKFGYTAIPIGETKTQGEIAREQFDRLYDSLDPIIKDYVHDKQGLINLIDCELDYEKGRFFKAIPNLRNRNRVLTETPINILKELDNSLKTIENTNETNKKEIKEIDI